MNDSLLELISRSSFSASDFASSVDRLFFAMLAVCGLLSLAVAALITVFCIRYRRGSGRSGQVSVRRRQGLEYFWTAATLAVFLGFFFWGAGIFMQLQRLPDEALIIQGVAKQWMWKFYHAGGQGEINRLHVPAGRPVIVRLASEDVIHSFFVPAFRVKQDVVPGVYTHTWFQAREPGVHRLFCAEYCGTEHSRMHGAVIVMEEEDYAAWLGTQEASLTLAAEGERLFRNLGCSGCHAPASDIHAPDLDGLYGRVVNLNDGSTVEADIAYLRDSILLPEKHVVAGYEPVMPSYSGQVSEEELLKLLNYLQSIGAGAGEAQ